MGLTKALEEAYRRWGEAAAIYKDRSRGRERYEVGYFRQKGDRLFFHVMGSGNTLEIALTSAPSPSLKPAPSPVRSPKRPWQ
jgi:hypothetical protein